MLPQGFPERMLHLLGEAEFAEFLASYERPRSAGLRLNPRKPLPDGASLPFCASQNGREAPSGRGFSPVLRGAGPVGAERLLRLRGQPPRPAPVA